MKKLLTFLTLLTLSIGVTWAATRNATIYFGSASGSTNINSSSVTGTDSQGNTWTITTEGTSSFTPNSAYAQVGSGSKPASSITFTTTLSSSVTFTSVSAKFGGFSNTEGSVYLKVGNNSMGGGTLNASDDVIINSDENVTANGTTLTVEVSNISKGVKCYYISYTYDDGGSTVETVATPTFNPAEGTFTEAQNVTISCATDGATIYYTTDGNDPTTSSTEYTEAIDVSSTTTIKAIAVKSGMNNSAVATAEYTINTPGSSTTFKLVKNQSGLVDGKRYIIVCNDYNVAATDLGSNKYLGTTDVSISNEIIDVYEGNNNAPLIFTLEENDASNKKWELKSGSNYLTETKVKELAWSTDKGGETITISSDGTATIKFTNGSLKYNSGSPRFTTYASGQKDIQLYVEDDGNTPPATEYTITVNQPSEGGEISADYASAAEGTVVTLTATPLESHTFGSWSVYKTGDENTTVTVDDDQFTMPAYDVTVTATFNAKPTNTITVNGGTANPTTAYEGQTVTVTPTIPEGKVLDSYTVNPTSITLASSGTGYTFTMPNEAVTVTFTFKDAPSGETTTATYIFNTDEGLAALEIDKPTVGNGTEIAGNTYTVGQVSFTSTNGGNGKTVVYNSQGNTDLRVYRGTPLGTFTLSVPSGSTITKIEIAGNTVSPLTVSTGSYNDGTWNGNAEEVTFTVGSSNIRINTINVTYIPGNAPDVVEYYLAGDLNGWGDPVDENYKFTPDPDHEGVYVLDKVLPDMENNDYIRFKIAKVVNGGTPVLYGGPGEGYNNDWVIYNADGHHTNIPTNGSQAYKMVDKYQAIFTLNSSNMTFDVEKPQLFLRESTNKDDWSSAVDTEMDIVANGGWTLTKDIDANMFFHFVDGWHEQRGTDEGSGEFWVNAENQTLDLAKDKPSFKMVTAGNYTLSVNSDKSKLNIQYNPPTYTAEIASGITGGSVSFNANSQVSNLNNLTAGYTVNVYVTPQSSDWELKELYYTIEGSTEKFDITATDNQYSFQMPAGNVTINAKFDYIGTATLTTYERLTNLDDVKIGEKYIIVNEDYSVALSGTSNGKTSISIDNCQTTISSDSGIAEFVICSSENANYPYLLKHGEDLYLSAYSSGTSLGQSTSPTSCSWTIDLENDGHTKILSEYNRLVYYFASTGGAFTAYSANNWTSNVYLYKVATPPTEATLAEIIALDDEADGKLYKISDANGLLGVYKNGTSVWFTDEKKAVDYQDPMAANYKYYTVVEKDDQGNVLSSTSEKDFHQYNWIEVVFPSETNFINAHVKNLTGTYTCENGNPKLELTVAVDEENDVTPVPSSGLAYEPNPYMAANFVGTQPGTVQGETSTYFFSQPKAQEYAKILWAKWDGEKFIMPTENNAYGFTGSFTIDLQYNITDNPNLVANNSYNFEAIIRKSASKAGPYKVYPTNLQGIPTAINGVVVNGEVKSVKYVNVAGMVSDVPFQGVNIVVTEYTDGSRTTSKMLRK